MRRERALAEQRADRASVSRVRALAEVRVADVPVAIDQVVGRPVLVAEGVPRAVVVVDGHGVADAVLADGAPDVADDVLERELGRVHPDDHEAGLP